MSRDTGQTRRGMPTPGVALPSDRRFRRADATPVRRRRLPRTVWGIGRWVLIACVVAVAGLWAGERLAASDLFLVRDITVHGNNRLSAGEIEMLLVGLREENVFQVDLERYRQRILASSWVEQVALSRVLPSTIVVDVVERTPMAVGRLNEQLYLIDRTGRIIDEYRAEYRGFDLPVIDGLLQTPQPGGDVDAARVALVASLFDALESRSDLQRRVSQVDATNPRDLAVMFDDDPTWLHLGSEAFAERLQRYLDLRPVLQDRFGSIDYVDLKFDERVYVRGQRTGGAGTVTTK